MTVCFTLQVPGIYPNDKMMALCPISSFSQDIPRVPRLVDALGLVSIILAYVEPHGKIPYHYVSLRDVAHDGKSSTHSLALTLSLMDGVDAFLVSAKHDTDTQLTKRCMGRNNQNSM
jgi:hypothetical protein